MLSGRSSELPTYSTSARFLVRLLATFDTFLLAVIAAWIASGESFEHFPSRFSLILLVPTYQALFHTFGLYESHRLQGFAGVFRSLLAAEFAGLMLCLTAAGILHGAALTVAVLWFGAANTAVLAAGRFAIYRLLRVARSRGMDQRYVCIIGSWRKAQEIQEVFAENPAWGMLVAIAGVTIEGGGHRFVRFPSGEELDGGLNEVLHREVIDEVIIDVEPERLPVERGTIAICEQYGVLGRVRIDYKEAEATTLLGEIPMPAAANRSDELMLLKRILDIAGAGLGLLAAGIPMMVIAILVRLSSPGAAIFRQRRIGLNGREFTCCKFRTMVDGADSIIMQANRSMTKGPVFKDAEDYRITNIGHFLRRYSLDELPQLFNVLKGDMSLVGPRPLPVREANAIAGEYRRRFRVLPGLTGVWQVSGRSDVEFERWMQYDLEYVDNWSLGLDMKVLLKTVPAVLSGKGAY